MHILPDICVEFNWYNYVTMSQIEGEQPPQEMPEEERSQRKVYVGSRGEQQDLREYVRQYCRPLYGSDAFVDSEGTIFIPQWYPVRKTERGLGDYSHIGPQDYQLLSGKRESEESYLSRTLKTKTLHELRISEVKGNNGAVETAIRMSDHILASTLERELPQMEAAGGRISELLDLFSDYSSVTIEQLEQAVVATREQLAAVGFNPETVISHEKVRIGQWLPKASTGRDSLGRPNSLITMMALEAAHRRVFWRTYGLGATTAKYVRIREALLFEREFSRGVFEQVQEWITPMRFHVLFQFPERPPQNVGTVTGLLNTMRYKLAQPHVKPYRPAGREVEALLGNVVNLLGQNRRQEIVDQDLFNQAHDMLGNVLAEYHDIYREEE